MQSLKKIHYAMIYTFKMNYSRVKLSCATEVLILKKLRKKRNSYRPHNILFLIIESVQFLSWKFYISYNLHILHKIFLKKNSKF